LLLVPLTLSPRAALSEGDLTASYRDVAGRIIGAALTDEEGWKKLSYLTTVIGHRLSGSPQLEEAIAWATETMRKEGLENVSNQPVEVNHWVRGDERLRVLDPFQRDLEILGLGRSVGTPAGGITAPAVVVGSFEELESLGRDAVEGKIVVYAVPWEGYGRTVRYRGDGASRAAALGAVAVLVRSATGRSIASPHTGALRYSDDAPQIPAAALTVEDAEWMRRVVEMGDELSLELHMEAQTLPDAMSANVIAEIRGTEAPEEVVVLGGHYDSWDVGQGAHDDGAGCIAAWQALRILQRLGLRPRRTLRVVLWTNEENGLAGGKAYRESVGDEIENHVAAIEMDGGAERPVGFGFGLRGVEPESNNPVYEAAYRNLQVIGSLLDGIDAGRISRGGGGADIGPLMNSGVPGLGLRTVGEHYFDWHHTEADTLDKIAPRDFKRAVAMLAVMSYILADMPDRLVSADNYGPLAAASP
jgi:hypothetical protein